MIDDGEKRNKGGRPRKADPPRIDYQLLDKLLVFGEVLPSDDGQGTTVVFPTYRDLADRFGVASSVIADYSTSRNCMRRRAEAQARIALKTDAKLVELRAQSVAVAKADALNIIDRYLVEFGKAVQEGRVRCDSVNDFNSMVRLKEFLAGGADSRQELTGNITLEALQLRHRNLMRVAEGATEAECGVVDGQRQRQLGGAQLAGVVALEDVDPPPAPIESGSAKTDHERSQDPSTGQADDDGTASPTPHEELGDEGAADDGEGPASSSSAGASSSGPVLEQDELP